MDESSGTESSTSIAIEYYYRGDDIREVKVALYLRHFQEVCFDTEVFRLVDQ